MSEYQKDANGNVILNKDGSPRKKAGRKKNSHAISTVFREKLTGKYIREMKRTFDDFGEEAMRKVAQDNPDKFLHLMAQLVPKQSEVKTEDVTEHKALSSIELANRIAGVLTSGAAEGTGDTGHREPEDMDTESGSSDGGLLH